MKKIKITTPENIELEVVLAEIMSRAIAAFIDMLLQLVVAILLGAGIIELVNNWLKLITIANNELYAGCILGILVLAETIVAYCYHIFFEIKWRGQTVGKKIMHLRVIRNNGGPVTAGQVIIRNLFRSFVDYLGIGIIVMLFSKANKRVGDMAAGTIVIVEETQSQPISLDSMLSLTEEIKSCLSQEECNLLREYMERKSTMADYEPLREEMKQYFKDKLEAAGIYENNKAFIEDL